MNSDTSRNATEIVDRLERAAVLYRQEMENRNVPVQLHDGLVRYLVHRIRPGHFLSAVIASDMQEAMRRADPACQRGLGSLLLFLVWVAPANSWGSYEALESWLDKGDFRQPDAHLGAVIDNSCAGGER